MRTRSLCVLTAALVLSTAITACGGSSSGVQTQQATNETISATTQAAATDTTVIETATEAISKPEPEPIHILCGPVHRSSDHADWKKHRNWDGIDNHSSHLLTPGNRYSY